MLSCTLSEFGHVQFLRWHFTAAYYMVYLKMHGINQRLCGFEYQTCFSDLVRLVDIGVQTHRISVHNGVLKMKKEKRKEDKEKVEEEK